MPVSYVSAKPSRVGRVLQRARTINEAELLFRRRSRSASSFSSHIPAVACFTNKLLNSEEDQNLYTSDDSDEEEEENDENFDSGERFRKRATSELRQQQRFKRSRRDDNNNTRLNPNLMKSGGSSCGLLLSDDDDEIIIFPKSIAWDWPFCDEGVARGVFTEDKFQICLPFNNGGTGETSGSTRKFEKISEANFCWTIGLCNSTLCELGGTGFWRMELEIMPNLNMLALMLSRDISRGGSGKRLKRVRKVYRLPDIYDVSTLTSTSYDWAIVIEAFRRRDPRTGEYMPWQRKQKLKRSDTLC
ncbi:hypothetical protein Ddc_02588 [Ditylenchus destructor]|nr:hypothetical protein Ddc_02588 [Ditylenchus destructor]